MAPHIVPRQTGREQRNASVRKLPHSDARGEGMTGEEYHDTMPVYLDALANVVITETFTAIIQCSSSTGMLPGSTPGVVFLRESAPQP